MSRSISIVALVALLAAPACRKTAGDGEGGGLPPAESWQAPPPLVAGGAGQQAGGGLSGAMGGADPHAGLDMGGAAVDMGGADPHAGLDMGGAGSDPAMAGLAPPDPDRAVDPTQYLRGRITAADAVGAMIKPGAILFISVKPIDPTTGEVIGASLAVDRLDITTLPIDFALSGANSMVAGTRFAGDVVINARIDGDGEARSRESGDIEGNVRATIPAANLDLVLDQLVK